jgi:hypothetical protein
LGADRGNGDRLAGGHVRGSRRNRQWGVRSNVNLRNLQTIGVRMLL